MIIDDNFGKIDAIIAVLPSALICILTSGDDF